MSDTTVPAVDLTVHASLNGWSVDLAFTMPPASLHKALTRLGELGYTPRAIAPQQPATPATAPNAGPPCCPVHGTAKVREGKHGLFCAAKRADGEYCREKPV